MRWTYAIQIALALKVLHDHNFIHGELNASNIMLSLDKNIAKIINYEFLRLSQVIDSEVGIIDALYKSSGSMKGNPNWMAPEQADEDVTALRKRIDIYAYGGILIELFSQPYHIPWQNLSERQIIRAQLQEKSPPELKHCKDIDDEATEHLQTLILDCLHYDISLRPRINNVLDELNRLAPVGYKVMDILQKSYMNTYKAMYKNTKQPKHEEDHEMNSLYHDLSTMSFT